MRSHSKPPGARRRGRGFTLVEMLLVLVILGMLAAIVVPKFSGRSQEAKIKTTIAQMSAIKTALDMFEVDMSYYPDTNDGLILLVEEPADADDWKGPYMEKFPKDAWGNEFIYEYPGKFNERGFDLMSMGPDRAVGGDDDIVNWETEDDR